MPGTKERRETQQNMEAFETWYREDRNFTKVSRLLTVSRPTLYSWADWFGWQERADERDSKVRATMEAQALAEKTRRLQDQLKVGTALRIRGTQYVANNQVDNYRDAIACIKAGIEIERAAEGLPSTYLAIANAQTIEQVEALEAAFLAGNN